MVGCESKTGHPKKKHTFEKILDHMFKKLLPNLDATINKFIDLETLHFDNEWDIIQTLIIMRGSGY